MSVAWTLILTSVGSCLGISALFLTSNGFYPGDNLWIILLNLAGGALLTTGSLGNVFGEGGSEFVPFVILNGVFALIAASGLARLVRKNLCGVAPHNNNHNNNNNKSNNNNNNKPNTVAPSMLAPHKQAPQCLCFSAGV
ncbi:unnamed protein product [Polarella glacialis]|uniref:CBU-0592-like domain-containing protein n=1 Tax=Polarella glacialis TaxID=89957 RepID=A0A813IVC4_POLGL|nr:unnamed protein product [Polarella glacialis]